MSKLHPDVEGLPPGAETVDSEEIRGALQRVLDSPQFRGSKRIRQFLDFVVNETLSGRGDQIKAYSVAIDCFERETDFDPQLDPYVRIVARRLRRALSHYYAEEGAGETLHIDVPKGSYVPRFRYDDTSSVGHAPMGQSDTGASVPAVSSADHGSTVAVVRFESHGGESDQDFLASGLTQEIILALSRFSEVLVIGPITVLSLGTSDSSPRDIGRDHDAEFVLMGSVQESGNTLRITASLSKVSNSTMIWAERYERDRSVADLFEVQDEIAHRVASTVGDAAGVIVRQVAERVRGRRPDDLSSYEAALRGFHWGIELTDTAFDAAYEALEYAVRNEPDYGLTKALLSDLYFSDWLSAIGRLDAALDRAETLSSEAVALDAFSSDARWARGQVHFARREWGPFRAEFDAARSLNPNKALYLASYGLFLVGLREWDEATEMIETAMQLNPQHPAWYHLVKAMHEASRGNWEASYAAAQSFASRDLMWGPLLRATALGHLGRAADAQMEIAALLSVQPRFANDGRELMGRLLYAEENVELIATGLAKAGLEIP